MYVKYLRGISLHEKNIVTNNYISHVYINIHVLVYTNS